MKLMYKMNLTIRWALAGLIVILFATPSTATNAQGFRFRANTINSGVGATQATRPSHVPAISPHIQIHEIHEDLENVFDSPILPLLREDSLASNQNEESDAEWRNRQGSPPPGGSR